MKSVGILTFSEADNYGAMLQTYALYKYIKNLGFKCKQIRYRNDTVWRAYHYASLRDRPSLKSYLKKNIELAIFWKKRRRFEKFRELCGMTSTIHEANLRDETSEYDKIIVGSDQVWNPRNTNSDMHFLLDFVNDDNKKVAYAASFGNTDFFSEFGEDAFSHISRIPFISVREQQGADFVRDCLHLRCENVCDPVILLSKKEWQHLCTPSREMSKEYIFVYLLKPNQELICSVNYLSKKENLNVIVVPGVINAAYHALKIHNSRILYDAGPNEMVTLINGAKYVMTDSFHGTALSIIMQKQFLVFVDQGKGNTNSRIDSILSICNLEERRVYKTDMIDVLEHSIEYNTIEEKLNDYRKVSTQFLQSSLE